jgi:hypothetical protein
MIINYTFFMPLKIPEDCLTTQKCNSTPKKKQPRKKRMQQKFLK